MPKKIMKWHKMLIRPQQIGLKPKKRPKRGVFTSGYDFGGIVNEDEVYHLEDRLERGEPCQSCPTIQHIYYNKSYSEEDGPTSEDDEMEVFSIDGSDEDFKDIIENEKYWSCDEEELEVYSPFEDSDNEVDDENGESMWITNGETMLHVANNADQIKKFLYLGYDVDSRDLYYETPLYRFTRMRNLDIIKALISAGANVNALNSCGQTPLVIAISSRCDMEILQELLNAGSNYSTVMNYFKEKVMHWAWTGELVLEFSKRGAYIDIKDRHGYTPLHRASRNSYFKSPLSAAQELIRSGADVNCRDDNGKTPLYHAIVGRRWDVMMELITNGADIGLVHSDRSFETNKCTALEKAIIGETIMGQVLIKHVLLQNWAKELDYTSIKKYVLNPYNELSSYLTINDFTNKCIGELSLMKRHMIGNCSMFDIIKSQIVFKKIKPLYIDYNINEEIRAIFPTYNDIITTIINKCKSRAVLLAKLKQKNMSLCSKDKDKEKSVVLNYDCILMICEHLSDEDLSVLLSV